MVDRPTYQELENQIAELRKQNETIRQNSSIQNEEKALFKSEQKYKDLIDTSLNLIWTCDLEGRYTYLSTAWEESHGYKIEEMLGKPFSDFQQAEIYERDVIEFTRHLVGGSVKNYETTHLHKDGTEISLIFNAIALKDSNANIIGTQGTAFNISARVKNEKLLLETKEKAEENENKFRTVFEDNNAMQLLIEPETGQIFDANQAACGFYGYEYSELISMNIQSLNQLSEEEIKNEMQEAKLLKRNYFEFRHKLANGTIKDVEVYSNPIIRYNSADSWKEVFKKQ